MRFLAGALLDGTPYTIRIENGELVFSRGPHRYAARGPAVLLDHLKAEGWELPTDAAAQLYKLAHQGAGVVRYLVNLKGHWERVNASDIDTALLKLKTFVDADIKEDIRILLLGRIPHKQMEDTL
ncbi:hypothetical protein F4Z98_05940 [Candidatus Poribacteria bacterium]|nr:hypothetical protein [Candidatus Poribacteria bacterium]MYB01780.1 hypothetical protein [Candidatus Poribacteria bacterium]MYI37342.1 hypothetical protein [Acidimicrobiaceae bacterium]